LRFKPGIKASLLLLGLLPAALIGVVMAGYFVNARFEDLYNSQRERGDLILKQLTAVAATDLADGNVSALRRLTQEMLKESDVVEVEVWDTRNKIAASRRNSASRESERLLLSAAVLEASVEGAAMAPRQIGSVRLVLSGSETVQRQRETLIHALAIGLGGLLLTGLLADRMGRRIGSPIISLTSAVHALSEGRLETRTNVPASAELAYLQAGFNAMAAELQKNRQTLEQQIQDATRQLQNTLKSLERRNAELDAARRNAERQTALKSQFLAQMSHEIRTPMNGIIGFAELLGQTPLNDEQNEKLRLIERSAKNLLAIINEILDLATLEAGKISLNIHMFMLRPYLEDAIALQMQRSPHLPVILWVAPDVPASVLGDPIRVQQVINNLLSNALKFTRRGRVVVRVRLQKPLGAPKLLFSVSDSGRGINARDLANLFVPFQQLSDYAIDRERGAGLGLTIANNIVDKMGGHLQVASRPGRGTTFWFDLPITQTAGEERLPPASIPMVLVDNDRLSRQALRFQLETVSSSVTSFASWEAFLAGYRPETHGRTVLLKATVQEGEAHSSMTQWLEQAGRLGARPVVILPTAETRLLEFYRRSGAVCLMAPVPTERLRKLILHPNNESLAKRSGDQRLVVPDLLGRTILIADDNEINRILLGAQLTALGASVQSAKDGTEALNASRDTVFDLIILDLQMPGMDGLTVIRELRKLPGANHDTPVIAITAHAQPAQRREVMEAGFIDCLIKPVTEEQLRQLIQGHLGPPRCDSSQPALPAVRAPHAEALLEKTSGNRELALTICRKLFTELPRQLTELNDAVSREKLEDARDITHKIHGSSAFCGLHAIREAAGKLERALDQTDERTEFETHMQHLSQAIQDFMAEEPLILETLSAGIPS
jgi:two-component system sensor histidine kinase BarA